MNGIPLLSIHTETLQHIFHVAVTCSCWRSLVRQGAARRIIFPPFLDVVSLTPVLNSATTY
jgi:hypothetical protein